MGLLPGDLRDQLLFRQFLVGLGLHACLLILGFERRGSRLLGEKLVLELDAQVFERGLGRLQRQPRVDGFLLDLRIAQFQDDRIGTDLCAGPQQNPFDATIGRGRQPPGVLGHERAEAPHLPDDGASLHGVREDDCAIDVRRRGFHPREREGDGDDRDDTDQCQSGLANPFALENCGVTGDVRHGLLVMEGQSVCHRRSGRKCFVSQRLIPICWAASGAACSLVGQECSAAALNGPRPR